MFHQLLTPIAHSLFASFIVAALPIILVLVLLGWARRPAWQASLAGLIPAPAGHTLYAASKAYLIKFSQALALENRRFGVNVLAVCPGFTYSEFHDVTGTRGQMKGIPSWLWMAAQPVVRDALDAVDRGDIVRVSGRANRMIKRLFAWLPDRLALRLIDQRGKDFRATDGQAAPTPD